MRDVMTWRRTVPDESFEMNAPTAGGGDDDRLATRKSLRALRGIAEGLAGHGKTFDPSSELAWDTEILHRCANHHDAGGEKLLQDLGTQRAVLPDFPEGAGWDPFSAPRTQLPSDERS